MHHFVVRKRHAEVFVEGVHHPKRQLMMVKFAVDRVVRHVGQCVVHPAHVPLGAEAQSAHIGRA